jgi:hypothetical protein
LERDIRLQGIDTGVSGRIILKRILKKSNGERKLDSSAYRWEQDAVFCEHENEHSG